MALSVPFFVSGNSTQIFSFSVMSDLEAKMMGERGEWERASRVTTAEGRDIGHTLRQRVTLEFSMFSMKDKAFWEIGKNT